MPRALVLASLLLASLCAAPAAIAESSLVLDPPDTFGMIPAATYDSERQKVGKAHLVVEELETGEVRLISDSGFTGGARTVMSAVFEPVDGLPKLRPVLQESRSFTPDGQPMGVMTIDHRKRLGRCTPPESSGDEATTIELPEGDRVANMSLNLLFVPLVRKETDELEFQIFLCGGGAKLLDFVANVAPGSKNGNSGHVTEVRYSPDFGMVSLVARSFIPKLSFWFDPQAPHRWMAHRVPLYGNGPEVFIVRDGVPTRWLADE